MEFLNDYSGLFSLLAVLVSLGGVVAAIMIYRKQKEDQFQDLKDEYEAMRSSEMFPMGHEERRYFGRKEYLEKKLGRK